MVIKEENDFRIHLSNWVVGSYLFWFSIHLILLLAYEDVSGPDYARLFIFSEWVQVKGYDFHDFLMYTLVPLNVLAVVNYFMKPVVVKDRFPGLLFFHCLL